MNFLDIWSMSPNFRVSTKDLEWCTYLAGYARLHLSQSEVLKLGLSYFCFLWPLVSHGQSCDHVTYLYFSGCEVISKLFSFVGRVWCSLLRDFVIYIMHCCALYLFAWLVIGVKLCKIYTCWWYFWSLVTNCWMDSWFGSFGHRKSVWRCLLRPSWLWLIALIIVLKPVKFLRTSRNEWDHRILLTVKYRVHVR